MSESKREFSQVKGEGRQPGATSPPAPEAEQATSGPDPSSNGSSPGSRGAPAPKAETPGQSATPGEDEAVGPTDSNSEQKKPSNVPPLKVGQFDGCGRKIENIYFKRADYIVYCTTPDGEGEKQIIVYYSNDVPTGSQQIATVAELVPVRNRLQFLLLEVTKPERYYVQIAEAFRLGLEQKIDLAKRTLDDTIEEVKSIVDARRRQVYVSRATPPAAISAPLLWILSAALLLLGDGSRSEVHRSIAFVLMAGGAGAIGALLSIAISVRSRTVETNGGSSSIQTDAGLRVLIGTISACFVCLVAGTGVLSQVQLGDMTFGTGDVGWRVALVLGFAAGFVERLVPDMLTKSK